MNKEERLFFKVKKVFITAVSVVIVLQGFLTIIGLQAVFKTLLGGNIIRLQKCLDTSKKWFITLLISVITIIAPSAVRITTDNATIPPGTFTKDPIKHRIISHMSKRSVTISNHQIYTDWVFLWWVAYTSELGGNVFIMLKKSLEFLPLLGYGMKNYKFIFLNRNWKEDELTMNNQLGAIDANSRGEGELAGKKPLSVQEDGKTEWDTTSESNEDIHWPYNIILFPEGTNLSANTRNRSAEYAAKIGSQPFKNVLLPRTTGLRFTLQKLKPSLDVVYDVTIGYSGVKQSEYGELIYRLPNIVLKGRSPKLVDIHIRAFKTSEIPVDDEVEFNKWLYNVWKEKDELLDTFYEQGSFTTNINESSTFTDFFKIEPFDYYLMLSVPAIISFSTFLFFIYLIF